MKFNQPQVLLALLVTQDGLPVGYEVYPGNTFEGHTLQAAIADLHLHYDIERIVFVADRGLLSQNNLTHLEAQEIPYIVGAKLKTLPQQEQRAILKQVGYLKQVMTMNPAAMSLHIRVDAGLLNIIMPEQRKTERIGSNP